MLVSIGERVEAELKENNDAVFIFDMTRKNWIYKGVLSAIFDTKQMAKDMGLPIETFDKESAEVFAIVYVDENKNWCWKGRIKFNSGNKSIIQNNLGKDSNETACLHEIYKLPLTEKAWFKNPCGTGRGILEIMAQQDMILSMKVRTD